MGNLSRRGFTQLTVGAVGLAALLGTVDADTASGPATEQSEQPDQGDQPPPAPIPLTGRAAYLHVVAHPDDDLYFMNPDVADSIRTGAEVTTVVISASEANGINGPHARANIPAYIGARQHGLCSAYAVMAGQPEDSPWRKQALATRAGFAELCTLVAVPAVNLVFLNISMGAYFNGGLTDLGALWDHAERSQPTADAVGDPAALHTGSRYSRDQLIDTLRDLMDRFAPTVVRTLDPDPDRRQDKKPWLTDSGVHTDNQDHTAAARFAHAAFATYLGTPAGTFARIDAYVGYGNARWKHNLGTQNTRDKLRLLAAYGWADHRHCADPAGCGDLGVGGAAGQTAWPQSTNLRHAGTTTWIQPGADGGLSAFGVVGGRVVRWRQDGSGEFEASRPTALDGPLVAHLAVAADGTGRAHVAALRFDPEAAMDSPFYQVVVSSEAPGGDFEPWQDLRTPAGRLSHDRGSTGSPALAVDATGTAHVFVRDADDEVGWARRDPRTGDWGPWTPLGGHRISNGLTALTNAAGQVEVHGDGPGLWSWKVLGPQMWPPVVSQLPAFVDPPSAAALADGGLVLAARLPDTAQIVSRYGEAAAWSVPALLGGEDGFGVIAALPHQGGLLLAQRGADGLTEVIWQPRIGSPDGVRRWVSGPGPIHQPALARDSTGRVVVGAVGPEGGLYTATIDPRTAGQGLTWVVAKDVVGI